LKARPLGLFVVATPNSAHFQIARQLLEAGKNVVVDKPMAITSAEIAELMEWRRREEFCSRLFS